MLLSGNSILSLAKDLGVILWHSPPLLPLMQPFSKSYWCYLHSWRTNHYFTTPSAAPQGSTCGEGLSLWSFLGMSNCILPLLNTLHQLPVLLSIKVIVLRFPTKSFTSGPFPFPLDWLCSSPTGFLLLITHEALLPPSQGPSTYALCPNPLPSGTVPLKPALITLSIIVIPYSVGECVSHSTDTSSSSKER